jgi:hypothetical protein
MLARYINESGVYSYECVHMQSELQHSTEFAGSFYARAIDDGGSALFLSSVTMALSPPPMTGDPAYVTYLADGTFDIATVKCDLGTHGTYQNGCVDLTIPDGAIDCSGPSTRHVWVAPTYMEWAPVSQPDILPIGDENGYATYISFTDCYYCCGWLSPYFGDEGIPAAGAGAADYGDCCLRSGKYAKIKMCYDPTIEVEAEHLAVAWWDCEAGEYSFDYIYYPATVEGFDIDNHTVEFATTCLRGPFVVVQLLDRECEGSIVVDILQVEPYCNGYTDPTPVFRALITDNVQGTDAINQSSIQWWTDLFESDQMVRFYNGAGSCVCDKWMPGFGSFFGSGYDKVSGIFRAGWNDPDFFNNDTNWDCDGCIYDYWENDYGYVCQPLYPLSAGDHVVKVSAMNSNIQSCTDTYNFIVDATPPKVRFADSTGAYVGENPYICIYFTDTEAGLDKNSIYIDIYGDETSSPDPNYHSQIATIEPAQLDWIDDTTMCVDLTFEYNYGYLHLFVYGGPDCLCYECNSPQYYYYKCGIADCVGNHTNVFWRYFTVDADGPSISFVGDDYCDDKLQFSITDDMSGLMSVYVYEDSSLVDSIWVDEHNPNFWWYDPSEDVERVDIEATDNIGNVTVFSFDMPTDCEGPTVKFDDGYVCKNPTIEFWVTDPAGVDWSSVNVYISGCSEDCFFYAEDVGDYVDTETGLVSIDGCHLDCSDGNEINVYVYSGTSYTGNGPKDVNGNYGKYRQCSFVVDAGMPSVSVGAKDERPIEITISDSRSGVDWTSLEFYEDGVLICSGLECMDETVNLDTIAGKLYYDADDAGGFEVEIRVNDMTGCNLRVYSFDVDSDAGLSLAFGDKPHNEPNPFDPSEGTTSIKPKLNKGAYVTIKIYDFAGEFVRNLTDGAVWLPAGNGVPWDGKTDGGTTVANGTYLCYVHARDEQGQVKTQVIKITVLKQDK